MQLKDFFFFCWEYRLQLFNSLYGEPLLKYGMRFPTPKSYIFNDGNKYWFIRSWAEPVTYKNQLLELSSNNK